MNNSKQSVRKNKIIKALFAVIFWIGVWFLAASLINKELIFPSPITVLKRIVRMAGEGSFWMKTGISVLRVMGGFVSGCIFGVLLAVLSSASSWADAIVSPFVRMVRSTPVTSFIILVMLWIGYDFVPVFIGGLMVTPVMFMNVREGISETDRGLLEVGRVYGFERKKVIKYIYLPSVKPYFVSGAVTSLGLAWKAGIAAEVICLPSNAIGREMYYSKLYLETPDLFAWTVVVVVFSIIVEKLLAGLMLKAKQKKEAYKHMAFENEIEKADQDTVTEEKETKIADTKEKETKETEIKIAENKKAGIKKSDNVKNDMHENEYHDHSSTGVEQGKQCIFDDSALRIVNVSVGYGDVMILKNLSLDIPKGITCIMGTSGKGKTTLLNTITGLIQPSEGKIEGRPEKISYMFQDDRLFPWLSAIDNISVVNNDTKAAQELLKEVELETSADKMPSELSGGMRRRIALARALGYDAGLLILDEPFKGLDNALKNRVARLIREKKNPVIITTHDPEDVAMLGAEKIEL